MDPTETLTKIRSALETMEHATGDRWEMAAEDAANGIAALDEWISKGGFLPTQWDRSAS